MPGLASKKAKGLDQAKRTAYSCRLLVLNHSKHLAFKSMKKLLLLCLLIGTGTIVSAQYPTIPSDRQAVMNQKKELRKKISDQAFARALPIIKEEAQNHNRPYVPWASKPEDLLRADIPAFPGQKAEPCIHPVDGEVKSWL